MTKSSSNMTNATHDITSFLRLGIADNGESHGTADSMTALIKRLIYVREILAKLGKMHARKKHNFNPYIPYRIT